MTITAICFTPGGAPPDAPIAVGGRTVFTPDAEAARGLFAEAREIRETALLREAEAPTGLLRRASEADTQRARELIKALLAHGEDCVIAAPPQFLRLLLRRMERSGFVLRRGGSGMPRHLERIRITERRDHCGGCSHNCLLKNPGCGVGRDKAARGY